MTTSPGFPEFPQNRGPRPGPAESRLSALLRGWWPEGRDGTTAEALDALVARLGGQGTPIDTVSLRHVLDPERPGLASPDLIRALHRVHRRPAAELDVAMALWRQADLERSAGSRAVRDPASAPARTPPHPPGAVRVPGAPVSPAGSADVPGPVRPGAGGRPRRRRVAITASAVVLVAVTAVLVRPWSWGNGDDAKRTAGGTPASTSTAAVAGPGPTAPVTPAESGLVDCRERECTGLKPRDTTCQWDARTLFVDEDPLIVVELRYSPKCRTAWAKMSRTTQGDTIRVTGPGDQAEEYRQMSGNDAHTPMVGAADPASATACALIARGTVCATLPVPDAVSPGTAGGG